jgi:hypothetical protein
MLQLGGGVAVRLVAFECDGGGNPEGSSQRLVIVRFAETLLASG